MNEIIKIIVTYNAKEILIELENKEFDVFDSFIEILSKKTGEQNILNNFVLMPINTSMPYILIDENNFKNIIEEKIENDNLKLFMNKKEITEEEEKDDDLILNNKNSNNKKNNDNEDDFSDNEEEKEIGNNKENNLNNEIVNDIKEKNFDDNDEDEMMENLNIKNEINIKKELDDIFEKDNLNINQIQLENKMEDYPKPKPKPKNKNNIEDIRRKQTMPNQILISDLFNKDKDINKKKEDKKKSKNIFENELCMKCSSPLLSQKNICLICSNMVLCNKCEPKHDHPCIIYKSNFIPSLKDAYNFMSRQYNFDTNSSNKKSKKNLSLAFIGDKDIFLRPNKGVLLPVKIFNHSHNTTIFSNDIIILVKGNKFLNISYDLKRKFKIPAEQCYILKLKCLTPKNLCKENITMEIYSNRYILKENKNNKISINIEVNEDEEEENMNLKLFYNEMAILYNKEHKKIIVDLVENELKGCDVDKIVETLFKYNWNKEKCLKNFKK